MAPGSRTAPRRRDSVLPRLEDLDAVAVGVADVEAPMAGEGVALAPVDLAPDGRERAGDRVEVVHDERRVGLAPGHARVLDADVELRAHRAPHVVRPEPGAPAAAQLLRLLDLAQPEPVGV